MQRSANTGGKHAIIRRDSEAFQALHRKIHETLRHRDEGSAGFKAWKAACEAFHSFESPMFDVGTGEGLDGLAAGDPELVDWAIAYLEVDPFHFRSGYCKARYIRRLKRLSLSQDDQQRLQVIVLRCLDDLKRAPSYYQRLAASFQSRTSSSLFAGVWIPHPQNSVSGRGYFSTTSKTSTGVIASRVEDRECLLALMNPCKFIGVLLDIQIDRPLGSRHPEHGFEYPVNYGFVPGTISGDGEPLDAYVLGVADPVNAFEGRCVAVIHRLNDDDDKLVIVPDGSDLSDEEIRRATSFQEQFFESVILRHPGR